jgi:AcrR family transcriptional regulator
MSNKPRPAVQQLIVEDVDARIRRSTAALRRALIALVQEHHFDEITVQQILERAGVSRATFYAHYRNKDDVLHSSFERVFLALEDVLDRPAPLPHRLFPVAEFLAHIDDAGTVVRALERGGQLDALRDLAAGLAARMIQRRLDDDGADSDSRPGIPRALLARMLAGALMEMIAWWEAHREAAEPAAMDEAFQRLSRAWLAARP